MKKNEIIEKMKKEFERVEGKGGRWQMLLIGGERIIYDEKKGFGNYFYTFKLQDQDVTWMTKYEALEHAFKFAGKMAQMRGFHKNAALVEVEFEKMYQEMRTDENCLIGKEMTVRELFEEMQKMGCYDESDMADATLAEVLESGVISFLKRDDESVNVEFEVTIMADKDEEWLGASYIKIKDIY